MLKLTWDNPDLRLEPPSTHCCVCGKRIRPDEKRYLLANGNLVHPDCLRQEAAGGDQ